MKQSISGPMAAVVIALALIGALLVFNRAKLAPEEEPPFVLPWAPPVEDQELTRLRQGLAPLGISVVWPPLGEDRQTAVRVAWVIPGSPAEMGGLQAGDAIQRFGDADTPHPYNLIAWLQQISPEQTSEAVVVREGEERTLVFTGIRPLEPEERVL